MLKYLALAYAGTDLSEADPSKLNFETFPPVFVGVGTNEIFLLAAEMFHLLLGCL